MSAGQEGQGVDPEFAILTGDNDLLAVEAEGFAASVVTLGIGGHGQQQVGFAVDGEKCQVIVHQHDQSVELGRIGGVSDQRGKAESADFGGDQNRIADQTIDSIQTRLLIEIFTPTASGNQVDASIQRKKGFAVSGFIVLIAEGVDLNICGSHLILFGMRFLQGDNLITFTSFSLIAKGADVENP